MTQDNTSTKRLLIFIYSLSSGGAERVTSNLANYWVLKGWDVNIVTLSKKNFDFYELNPKVRRISLEMISESSNILVGLWQNAKRIASLRQLLRQIKPDFALGMMTTANIVLALAAWGLPNLLTIGSEHVHPPQLPLGYVWEKLRRYSYSLLDAVTALTKESESWLQRNTDAKKVFVIPNAIAWPLSVQEPRVDPNVHRAEKILLSVGRLEIQKGFDLLIEAFSKIAQKYPEWNLVILGEGSQRSKLETQILNTKLSTRVFLPGRAGNMSEWYSSAHLFVMSSRFEGFPMTLVEAMASGLAVISFNCDTGPRDIIRHNVDGILVSPSNVHNLAEALNIIMGDEKTRFRLARQATSIKERYSMEKIIKLWEQLFDNASP